VSLLGGDQARQGRVADFVLACKRHLRTAELAAAG
jgi:hypothetical protein